jgi:hypothetical protein
VGEELFLDVFANPCLDDDVVGVVLVEENRVSTGSHQEMLVQRIIGLPHPSPREDCRLSRYREAGACGGTGDGVSRNPYSM